MKSQEIIYRGIAEQCRAVQNGEQSIDNATNEILALFQSEPSKAIEFAEWLSDNFWRKKITTHPNKVGQYYSDQFGYKPIQELYDIFTNQRTRQEKV